MKKLTAIAVVLIFALSLFSFSASAAITAGSTDVNVWDGSTASSFSGGSGLATDPYIIKTGAELDYLASSCMGGETYADTYFKLVADIDWAGNVWTPIGYDTKALFSGHFDGNGQTIYNLTCFDTYAGLFGCIKEGSVKNLKVDHATFTTDTRYAGAIASWMKLATIEGVSAGEHVTVQSSDVMSNTAQIGGLFGLVHSSTVNASEFEGTVSVTSVTGTSFLGGIAGVIGDDGVVKNCINRGSVNNVLEPTVAGSVCYVGGIAGGVGASGGVGSVENCVNYGEVKSIDVAGGVVGRIHVDNSVVKNSYNLALISGERAGSVIGYISKAYVLEGNMGISCEDAPKAVGTFVAGEGYSEPGDKNAAISTEMVITIASGYLAAEGELQSLLPVFNTVTPVEVVQTTAPETEKPADTEAPDNPDTDTEKAPETEETPVQSGSAIEPAATDAPAATEPAPEKGCGGSIGFAAVVICIIGAAFVTKRD